MGIKNLSTKKKIKIAILSTLFCIAIPALDHRLSTVRYEIAQITLKK